MVTRPLDIMPSSTGRKVFNLFLRVDDLDDDRQILREPQELGGMNTARMAESDMATQDGCTAEVHLPRLQDDGLMKRNAINLVIFAKEYPEQDGLPSEFSFFLPHFVGTAPRRFV